MRALAQAVEWEQQLANQLFGSHSEKVLIMVSREAIDSMVTTGVQLGGGRQFAEKLFPVLDMIGCLRSPELSPLLTKVRPCAYRRSAPTAWHREMGTFHNLASVLHGCLQVTLRACVCASAGHFVYASARQG